MEATLFEYNPVRFFKTNVIEELEKYDNISVIYIFYLGIYDNNHLLKYGRSKHMLKRYKKHVHTFGSPILCYLGSPKGCLNTAEKDFENFLIDIGQHTTRIFKNKNMTEFFTISSTQNLNMILNTLKVIIYESVAIDNLRELDPNSSESENEYGDIKEEKNYKKNTKAIIKETILYTTDSKLCLEDIKEEKNYKKITKEITPETITNFRPCSEKRVILYLNCLKTDRFCNKEDWITIGNIIFNEHCSLELYKNYSKNYTINDITTIWNSFKTTCIKHKNIKMLIQMAEEDIQPNTDIFMNTLQLDTDSILDVLFTDGVSDTYMAYLFFSLQRRNFLYISEIKSWFSINQYGIYIKDTDSKLIKQRIESSLIIILRNEYIRLQNNLQKQIDLNRKNNYGHHNFKLNKQLELLGKTYSKIKTYYTHEASIRNLLEALKRLFSKEILEDETKRFEGKTIFDMLDRVNLNLVGFTNGVYDLQTNTFRNALHSEYITTTTQYAYTKADSVLKKELMALLKTIFSDSVELEYVLKHIAIRLHGTNLLEQFYVWIGSGSNGKGVLAEFIQMVLGKYFSNLEISQLYKASSTKKDAPNSGLSSLKSARFVMSTEPDGNTHLDSSLLKSFSGNDKITTRELYGKTVSFFPTFQLYIQTNIEPVFAGFDSGMKRRVVLINFPNKFVYEVKLPNEHLINNKLKSDIKQNKYRAEFLEILIEHYMLFKKDGLKMPPRIEQDTNAFIKNNDPVNEWFSNNIMKAINNKTKIKSSLLYTNFLEFMENDDRGISTVRFKAILTNMGVSSKKYNDGQFYIGIEYKPQGKKKDDKDKKNDDSDNDSDEDD